MVLSLLDGSGVERPCSWARIVGESAEKVSRSN